MTTSYRLITARRTSTLRKCAAMRAAKEHKRTAEAKSMQVAGWTNEMHNQEHTAQNVKNINKDLLFEAQFLIMVGQLMEVR